MSDENNDADDKRVRTIRWDCSIDELAIHLAKNAGFYPEKQYGGVSAFLASLVEAANENSATISEDSPMAEEIRNIKKTIRDLEKKVSGRRLASLSEDFIVLRSVAAGMRH